LKKLPVILLLLILTAPFLGTYIFIQYKKNNIRKEVTGLIIEGLAEKNLVLLKFTREESETGLTWKHSREFEYNGQMYDIVDQSQSGDSVFYTCYKDHKETRLNAKKEKLIARAIGQDPVQKNQTERLKNLFNTVYSRDAFAWKPDPPQPTNIHYSLFTIHYSLFTQSPPSPPPKCS
jgi:hypothetical protein